MSTPKNKIITKLKSLGFEQIQLFYWPNDGWYLHCAEAKHFCIGYNYKHVLSELNKHNSKYHVLKYDAGLSDDQLLKLGVICDHNIIMPG